MVIFFELVIIAIILWVDYYVSKQFYNIAVMKGFKSYKYFWLCFFLSTIGYLIVIALPDRYNSNEEANYEYECSNCGTPVYKNARKCPNCGAKFE